MEARAFVDSVSSEACAGPIVWGTCVGSLVWGLVLVLLYGEA